MHLFTARMLQYYLVVVVAYHWLNLLRLIKLYLEIQQTRNRRWHVKPYLTDLERESLGAYRMMFLYFANNDSEGFYNMVRMNVKSFRKLYNVLHDRLLKNSFFRRPLSGELRLALTLRSVYCCLNF